MAFLRLASLPQVACVPDYARRNADDDRVVGYIFVHYGSGPDHRALADGHPRDDRRIGADRCAPAHAGALDLPIGRVLQGAILVRGARVTVVDEHDAVADEYLVLDDDALANERVRGDLATRPDLRVL